MTYTNSMTRTFIAIELQDEVRSHLRREIQRLMPALPHARWVDPTTLHLTLAFLGELDEEQLEQATDAALMVARTAQSFRLHMGSPGIFGPAHSPRVIWISVAGDLNRLLGIQSHLAARLVASGFPPEERPYAPHLTLARIKEPLTNQELAALRRLIASGQTANKQHRLAAPPDAPSIPTIIVEHLSVMKSELTSAGPRYTRLCVCPFGG
jgi:2'-5' RNA ligase